MVSSRFCFAAAALCAGGAAARCGCSPALLANGRCDAECDTALCSWDHGECEQEAVRAAFMAVDGMCDSAAVQPPRRLCGRQAATPAAAPSTCALANDDGYISVAVCGRGCAKQLCHEDARCAGVVFHEAPRGGVDRFILIGHLDYRGAVPPPSDAEAPAICLVKNQAVVCLDTCPTAGNGVCEDAGSGCAYGTDCADCGVRQAPVGLAPPKAGQAAARAGEEVAFIAVDFCWTERHQTARLCAAAAAGHVVPAAGSCHGADTEGLWAAATCDAACLSKRCAADAACAGVTFLGGATAWDYDAGGAVATLLWRLGGYESTGTHLPCAVKPSEVLCSDACLTARNGVCDDGAHLGDIVHGTCALGTDCADCGPRARPPPEAEPAPHADLLCSQACPFWNSDGVCQDGGPGANAALCPYGSDCADCGERVLQPVQTVAAPHADASAGISAGAAVAIAVAAVSAIGCAVFAATLWQRRHIRAANAAVAGPSPDGQGASPESASPPPAPLQLNLDFSHNVPPPPLALDAESPAGGECEDMNRRVSDALSVMTDSTNAHSCVRLFAPTEDTGAGQNMYADVDRRGSICTDASDRPFASYPSFGQSSRRCSFSMSFPSPSAAAAYRPTFTPTGDPEFERKLSLSSGLGDAPPQVSQRRQSIARRSNLRTVPPPGPDAADAAPDDENLVTV